MNEPALPGKPAPAPAPAPAAAGAVPLVLALPGEIDYANAGVIAEELTAALTPGLPALVIDMTATTFCDSAGIGALARAHGRAAITGTHIHLAASPGPVTRLLHLTGLDQLWSVHPSLTAALREGDG